MVVALALAQPVAAQSFKPDFTAGWAAYDQKDYATALKHFSPLAELGNAEVQFWLGHMYYKGNGVTQDYAEAVRWWRKAAKHGWAQKKLASLEEKLRAEGNWPPRSRHAEAKAIFTPDFKAGVAAYEQRDYATAFRNLRPFARQGFAGAQYYLGTMYRDGKGIVQDLVMSYVWLNVGVANGLSRVEERDKALARLNAAERKLGLMLSALCHEKPVRCPKYSFQ